MSFSNEQSTDFELVTALKAGCRTSFKSLYMKYSGRVYYVAKRFRLTHEEAENIVQDVFMKIWEKKDSLIPDLSFNAYVQTIARNEILKMIRRSVLEHAKQHYLAGDPASNSSATENMVGFSELTSLYREVISRLSDRRRQIFLMNREVGLSVDEIARMTELSVRTVENHIFQATRIVRNELREQLDQNDPPGKFFNGFGSPG
jgi:RNA polymerase sigma-70 factor (ECF subfamily)